MSRFIETIKYDHGTFHLLDYHQDRVNRTFAQFYPRKKPHVLKDFLPDIREVARQKVRIIYDQDRVNVGVESYTPKTMLTIKVVSSDIGYAYKFANREEISALLTGANADEIIIMQGGVLTDASYANVAFFDGDRWLTPSRPLLAGVKRAALLDIGKLEMADISIEDLKTFSKVSLINAMLDLDEVAVSIAQIL